jgi:hypothetical protein
MSNNRLSYLNKNFDDYRESLIKYARANYPNLATDFNDASIGSWLIDMMASIGDNLSFYIDKVYSETNLETAKRDSSLRNLARNNGFKTPGPKGAMAEVIFSCVVPAYSENSSQNSPATLGVPVGDLLPVIKKGTKVSSRNQIFEVMEDIDFASQFDNYGYSDRTEEPIYGNTGLPVSYRITKRAVVSAGESKIYRQVITARDIVPFMEIILPDKNVMNVESIIFKDGADFESDPSINEFMMQNESAETENVKTYRFFEVDSLAEQTIWGDVKEGQPEIYYSGLNNGLTPVMMVTRGEWRTITQKFITEFTDNGYLKIIFGAGEQTGTSSEIPDMSDIAKYQISKMMRNNFLGKLPPENVTMYVLYRVGGGAVSNVAAGAINNISYLNAVIGEMCSSASVEEIAKVKNSITVTNPQPSVTGKDAPTADELKNLIKYNSGAQKRCVTLKDYENRVLSMPPRYGCPFRVSAIEENNKVMLYFLGLTYDGKLSDKFPTTMIENVCDYLSKYRMLNDYVEIKPGKIINIGFEITVFVDKNYVYTDVVRDIINTVRDYMDIKKHGIGEDIFVGDIEKNISDVDGVINLVDMTVNNYYGGGKYGSKISQPIISDTISATLEGVRVCTVDIDATDYILNSSADSMFEIKNPDSEITVHVKQR